MTFTLCADLFPAVATEIKKSDWLASCPEVVDLTPTQPAPKTQNLVFQNSGQVFRLLKRESTEYVTEPTSAIGCYVIEPDVSNVNTSPPWQIGSLNRDNTGYYFKNAAGNIWRLMLSADGNIFEIQPGSAYYKDPGMGFKIDTVVQIPTDCKMEDYRMGGLRLGFPRSKERVQATGSSRNLIIVLDYPDAPYTGNLTDLVNKVLAPKITNEFFVVNSYGRLELNFDVHPKVVRINSSEKSFAPNRTGGFFVNGVQQDTRLISEALAVANTQADLSGYQSINFFAPTGDSLKFYGSAHIGFQLQAGRDTLINSQLVSGVIGDVNSPVPSWKVFAHEYGHLLGMYDLYIAFEGNTGKSPGPFDLMGNITGSANTFLGFNRWVQGWLDDSDVQCAVGTISNSSYSLAPINSTSGKRIYVRPISGTKALIVEYRTNDKFDQLGSEAGLLVYSIDFTVGSIKGPVQVHHSEQDKPITFNSDLERYRAATLTANQYVLVDGIGVYANSISPNLATFSIMTQPELNSLISQQSKPVLILDAPNKVKKTITCLKGTKQLKVRAIKPNCPSGYRKK